MMRDIRQRRSLLVVVVVVLAPIIRADVVVAVARVGVGVGAAEAGAEPAAFSLLAAIVLSLSLSLLLVPDPPRMVARSAAERSSPTLSCSDLGTNQTKPNQGNSDERKTVCCSAYFVRWPR